MRRSFSRMPNIKQKQSAVALVDLQHDCCQRTYGLVKKKRGARWACFSDEQSGRDSRNTYRPWARTLVDKESLDSL